MPKKKKPSLIIKIWKIIIGAIDYFLVALVPPVLAIIGFLGGNKNMMANVPPWIWIVATLILLILAFSKGSQRYKEELENESKKHTRSRGKSIQSKAEGGQSLAIGGDNFAPIIQENENRQRRPDLTSLTEIRERGYLLRNKGIHLEDEKLLPVWIEDFESWNTEMLNALGELDKDRAKLLKVLGNISRGTMYYPRVFGEAHALKLDVFTEKLARLDKIIEDYLKIPVQVATTIKASIPKESVNFHSSDFRDFSIQLDKITKGKNISSVGLGFLSEIKSSPPFLGINRTNSIISKSHEKILTEFFYAQIYIENNRNFIRGGNYTIKDGENSREIVAKRVYGHERYIVWVQERATYPTGLILELPYLNVNSPDDPEFIKRQISINESSKEIVSLLQTYNLVEHEAIPLLRMVYDAAQRTLDDRKKDHNE